MESIVFVQYGDQSIGSYIAYAARSGSEMTMEEAIRINEWLQSNADKMLPVDWYPIDLDTLANNDKSGSIIVLFVDEELAMEFKLSFVCLNIKP